MVLYNSKDLTVDTETFVDFQLMYIFTTVYITDIIAKLFIKGS